MLITCENCGREFEKTPSKAKKTSHHFCSRECYAEFQRNRVKLECDYCGKRFEKVPSKVRNHNFCSERCKAKFFNEHRWPREIDESDIDKKAVLKKPEDLGYVLGCLIGDGWVTTEYRIGLAAKDRGFVLKFKESLERLKEGKVSFGSYKRDYKVKDKIYEDYEMFEAKSSSKKIYFQLKPLYKELLNHQKIPIEEEAFKKELIAGFYDSEGCYLTDTYDGSHYYRVRIYNSNRKLLKFFSEPNPKRDRNRV